MLIQLEHYSHKNGLTVIDPQYEGTGVRGEEAKRRVNYASLYRARSSWYLAEETEGREEKIVTLPYHYTAEVEDNDLYPYGDDPYGLWPQGDMPTPEKVTRYEARIKGVGYKGMLWPGEVRLFVPVPCTQENKPTL